MARVKPIGVQRTTRLMASVGLSVLLVIGAGGNAEASPPNRWPATFVAAAIPPPDLTLFVAQANGAVTSGGYSKDNGYRGDARQLALKKPITGIAVPYDGGYWLVAGDGGVFSYGGVRFYGSMAGRHLNQPVVGIASTAEGRGYWLVAADGGVFGFGAARFHGSLAGRHLDQPIVGIVPTYSGNGYRLVARDGGVFAFGDATYHGSLGGRGITDVVGMAGSGKGYWILRKFGGKFCNARGCAPGPLVPSFGDAPAFGAPSVPNGNIDFVHDPAVAIVAGVRGIGILRANGDFVLAGEALLFNP